MSGHSRRKPCRLIPALDGGGSGGFEKVNGYAWNVIKSRMQQKGDHTVLAPAATKHVADSRGTLSNELEPDFDVIRAAARNWLK